MSGTPEDDDKRAEERRRLIDLTRREKGLPERRKLGTDRRAPRPGQAGAPPTGGDGDGDGGP